MINQLEKIAKQIEQNASKPTNFFDFTSSYSNNIAFCNPKSFKYNIPKYSSYCRFSNTGVSFDV